MYVFELSNVSFHNISSPFPFKLTLLSLVRQKTGWLELEVRVPHELARVKLKGSTGAHLKQPGVTYFCCSRLTLGIINGFTCWGLRKVSNIFFTFRVNTI